MSGFKENLNNQREKFINIFNDTLKFIEENKILKESVEKSKINTSIHRVVPNNYPEVISVPQNNYRYQNVYVTKNRTFEAAYMQARRYPGYRAAVLNFASATSPGGGVTKGSSAQEESLCRCSTLYPCLNNNRRVWNEFYLKNRNNPNPLHTDDIVYTKDVIICKSDDGLYTRLPESMFLKVDVITCAAPNLREKPSNYCNQEGTNSAVQISDDELYKLHVKRAKHILWTAYSMGARILILGAFGCGAFKNNPHIVAKAYKEALKDLGKLFIEIEFAVYCKNYETENYDAFAKEFE